MGSHHPLNHATSPLPVTPSFPSYKKREGRKCTIINFHQEPGAISPGQVLCDTFPRRSALRPSIIVLLRRSHGHVSALRPYPFLTTATRAGADLVIPIWAGRDVCESRMRSGYGSFSFLCTLCVGSAQEAFTIQPKKATNGMNGVGHHHHLT